MINIAYIALIFNVFSSWFKKKNKDAERTTEKLSEKLSKTRTSFISGLKKFFGVSTISSEEIDEMEEKLLSTDIGLNTTTILLQKIKSSSNGHNIGELIRTQLKELFDGLENGFNIEKELPKPYIINIVGVNGVGKTTTIGKLAEYFRERSKKVLIGAADTFRAGAISQLKIWAERSSAQFVGAREGQDPGAVVYDALNAAKARDIDIVLLDTAGRLHTKYNLMEELKKISRVIQKVIPEGPHETWLIIDGTFGQNSLSQTREFQKALNVTGVIVTKLDGTAKGGVIFSIAHEFRLPVKFIGIGEGLNDLLVFEPKIFVDALFNEKT